jgi:hypothetical protein
MSQIVTIDGAKLLVHAHDGHNVVEAYELALFLGYAQQHLIRKQVLTDWSDHFKHGRDYLLVMREADIRTYEAEYALRHHGKSLRAMKPHRGRIFLLPDGLRQVLLRSSKKRANKLLRSLERKNLVPTSGLQPPSPRARPEPRREAAKPGKKPDVPKLLERRRQDYDVLQKLLEQLMSLEGSPLALLAIEAAEVLLGRSLDDLRESVSSRQAPPRPGRESRGPIFGDEGYYSLTQIGKMGGGYSAKAAGRAANVVAGRWGFEQDDIRTRELWFNDISTWTDDGGREHELFRFNREFSNLVLDELRASTKFRPEAEPFPAFSPTTPSLVETDVAQLVNDG